MKNTCHNCAHYKWVVLRAKPKRLETRKREASPGRALGKAPMCTITKKFVARQGTCPSQQPKAKKGDDNEPQSNSKKQEGQKQKRDSSEKEGKGKEQGSRRPRREERDAARQKGARPRGAQGQSS